MDSIIVTECACPVLPSAKLAILLTPPYAYLAIQHQNFILFWMAIHALTRALMGILVIQQTLHVTNAPQVALRAKAQPLTALTVAQAKSNITTSA